MTRDEIDAVFILNNAFYELNKETEFCSWPQWFETKDKRNAQMILFNAIRHICEPYRNFYES